GGDGTRGGGVDGAAQLRVVEGAVVDVEEVVQVDPRQPLAAAAETPAQPGREQRPLQAQGAAEGALHDAGAHLDGSEPGTGAGLRRLLPGPDHPGEEIGSCGGVLPEELAGPVVAVEPDGRGADEDRRPVVRLRCGAGQVPCRRDPA